MSGPWALLDSNVVIAAVAEAHKHHAASVALFAQENALQLAVAAHSYAEAFTTLTRRSANAAFRWSAADAWDTLESIAAATVLVGLSPAQTLDAVRGYAQRGGIGAQLYDRLIGQAAIYYGIPRIITWNVAHMRDLFTDLDIVDPVAAIAV